MQGAALWQPQSVVDAKKQTPALLDEASIGACSSAAAAVEQNQAHSSSVGDIPLGGNFFRIAERGLPQMTLLGQTTIAGVDFFAQSFTLLEHDEEPDVVAVAPNERMLLDACHWLQVYFSSCRGQGESGMDHFVFQICALSGEFHQRPNGQHHLLHPNTCPPSKYGHRLSFHYTQ